MDEIVVHAVGLVKKFGNVTAVDGIDVNVRKGEIFGFLGPNGAGKTTTMKMITTITPPTSGTIEIEGHVLKGLEDPAKEKIGIVQQHIALDKDTSVMENIRYHAMLHRMPKEAAKKKMSELVAVMGLEPYLDTLIINLSGGWKRRVAIVCAMLHDPSILFLDEPTTGLDTQSRHLLWNLIRKLNADGKTIFLTTHHMDEAEELCHRISIINKGKIIAEGSPKELCERLGKWTVEVMNEDGSKRYHYFQTMQESRDFQDSFPEDAEVSSRRTNLEYVFLELTGRNIEKVVQEVKFRI